MENPAERRKLNFEKCSQCRRDKQKCLPVDRTWPRKCDRCKEKNYNCSANSPARERRNLALAETPLQTPRQDESADIDKAMGDLIIRLTWTNRVGKLLSDQRAFETRFIATMGLEDDRCRSGFSALDSYQNALLDEREKTTAQIQDLLASEARVGIDLALALAPGQLIGPLNKGPGVSVPQGVFREPGNCVLAMKMIEAQGLHDISKENVHLYLQSCSTFIHEVRERYATTLLCPPDPYLCDWLPTEEKTPLDNELSPLAKDVLNRTLTHVLLYRNEKIESADANWHSDFAGRSLLHIASYNGDIDALRLVLDRHEYSENVEYLGGYKTSRDNYGLTPLHYAARTGHEDVVEELLDCEFNRELLLCKDEFGRSPLFLSAMQGHGGVVRLLLRALAEKLPRDELTSIINAEKFAGWTILHHAAHRGHASVIEALIEVDIVDVNIQCVKGYSPIHVAARQKLQPLIISQVLDLLRRRPDFDINIRSKYGLTALHYAIISDDEDTAVCLLGVPGIDIAISTLLRNTALHLAAESGLTLVVRSLIDLNPRIINSKNYDDRTALHSSVICQQRNVVALLLTSQTIDVNARDRLGRTPFIVAQYIGAHDMMKMLLKTGQVDAWSLEAAVTHAHHGGQGIVPSFLLESYQQMKQGLEIHTLLEDDSDLCDCDYDGGDD